MKKIKTQRPDKEHKPLGRPRLTDELLDTNLQVRVTKKLADTCKSLGGANFMRPLLEAATQRAMALKKLAPARPVEESESIKFIDLTVQCGFPSPAADYAENDLSLNDYFVKNKDATFVIEARGDSMIDAGIYEGDILIIDRSIEPRRATLCLPICRETSRSKSSNLSTANRNCTRKTAPATTRSFTRANTTTSQSKAFWSDPAEDTEIKWF